MSGRNKADRSSSHREPRGDALRDLVVNYLFNIAEDTGDKMPNKEQVHLPSSTKKQVYQDFVDYVLKFYPKKQRVPSMNYFYAIWKQECSTIKTHRNHGFTVCSKCEMIRSRMEEAIGDKKQLELLKKERLLHLTAMREERRQYAKRRDLSITRPGKYYSIILDGADQKSYGLPHFTSSTKSDRGHKVKVKCVGVLEHLKRKCLNLFTITEEFQSSANHVIEAAHRVIQAQKDSRGGLPPVLFVQADNCTRENKNRYLMAYFEMLVAKGVFVEVQVSCLPVGHTHTDIDQSFSSFAIHLRAKKAVTMDDLLEELSTCYSPKALSSNITKVANFSGLCESLLNSPLPFSHFRFFKFTRTNDDYSDSGFSTTCDVKVKCSDEWEPLRTKEKNASFLKEVPDLGVTPPTITKPPENIIEVNRHFFSVEERIGDTTKITALRRLRDRVYEQRSDPFGWDLSSTFEENGEYRGGNGSESSDSDNESDASSGQDLEYEPGSFVAVKTGRQERCRFWIARILRFEGGTSMYVRWYTVRGVENEFDGRYEVASRLDGPEPAPYDAWIDKSMILVYFQDLTKERALPVAVKSAIRVMLDSN